VNAFAFLANDQRRIASGRGAMEQPNVTHDGEARLTPKSGSPWRDRCRDGLFGDLLMWILAECERAGFHYHSGYSRTPWPP